MTLTELATRVDITVANLSILKNDRARAVRFSTLTALCEALDCQPGELLSVVTAAVEVDDRQHLEERLLERAALVRVEGERQIAEAVTAARTNKVSWQRIGELLGMTAQAAQQRYRSAAESAQATIRT